MAYLLKSRHGFYYFRMVVPERYREALGKREIRRSLGTSSIREARRRVASEYLKAMDMLENSAHHVARCGYHDDRDGCHTSPHTGISLTQFFKEHYTQHLVSSGVRDKTFVDKRCLVNLLVAICGDKSIDKYSKSDARLFRDTALELPPRKTFRLLDEGYSIEDIKRLEGNITTGTVNNWIRNLGALFKYACSEELCTSNPFSNMSIKERVRANSLRDRFSDEDIKRVLAYTSQEASQGRLERYWLPLLGLYTGARLGELAQLFRDDIKEVEGIWFIHIQENHPTQRLKNLSSERVIPIHSKLIELGFLEYVERSDGHIFPNLKYHPMNGYRDGYSKHFSWMLGKLSIKSTEHKVSFHSYRHFVADTLKQQSVPETQIGALLGHTVGGITNNRYGKSYQVGVLKEVVEKIRVSTSYN